MDENPYMQGPKANPYMTGPDAITKSEGALANLSFPKRLAASMQAIGSVAGDIGSELAGGLGYVKTRFVEPNLPSSLGFDGSHEAALEDKQNIVSKGREFFAPDDPAEAEAKDILLSGMEEYYDAGATGIKKLASNLIGMKGESRQEFVEKPLGESMGDASADAGAPPIVSTALHMLPATAEMVVGAKGAKSLKGAPKSARTKAAEAVPEAKPLPTIEELKAASSKRYAQLDSAGIHIRTESARGAVASLRQDKLLVKGMTDSTLSAINHVDDLIGDQPMTMQMAEDVYQLLRNAADDIQPREKKAALRAVEKWEQYMDDISPGDYVTEGADPKVIRESVKEARTLWGRARRAEEIADMIDKASVDAAGLYTGAGFEHALRKYFRRLYKNEKRMNRFTAGEKELIRLVATGSKMDNFYRNIGKLAPTGGLSMWLGIGAAASNPALALVPITGAIAKKVATKRGLQRTDAVDNLVRGGPEQ